MRVDRRQVEANRKTNGNLRHRCAADALVFVAIADDAAKIDSTHSSTERHTLTLSRLASHVFDLNQIDLIHIDLI